MKIYLGDFAPPLDSLIWVLSSIAPGQPASGTSTPSVLHEGDASLVRRIQAGDRKAIADFVADHGDAIFGYIQFRLAPRTEQVDDVFQDVFLAAWRSLGNYRGDSSLRAWLLGIARHKIEDVYRSRLREHDSLPEADTFGEPAAPELLLDEQMDRNRARERAGVILSELPEHYRIVLLWRYWGQRSTTEIATATGKTEKAVERLLSRARESFRKRWEDGV